MLDRSSTSSVAESMSDKAGHAHLDLAQRLDSVVITRRRLFRSLERVQVHDSLAIFDLQCFPI